jgi:sugar phosphate isomerase/epimerase
MQTRQNTNMAPAARAAVSRRGLLGGAAAGAVAGTTGQLALAAPAQARHVDRVPRNRISIQLFTVRDQLRIDFAGTLAALAEIGYTRVEHAGFVGRTAAEFKAALDAAGLRATSGHVAIPQPFDDAVWNAALADASLLGARFIVHPSFGQDPATGQPIRDAARYRAFAGDLNRAGLLARRAGLQFGYHNHQLEFLRLDNGRTGFDVLTAETDARLVHLEVDLFWALRGARDPVDLIRAHRGRVRQVHVKDLNVAGSFEDPGQGLVDFGRIFERSREAGLVEYIVERDDAGRPPRRPADALTTAQVGFDYLDSVRF